MKHTAGYDCFGSTPRSHGIQAIGGKAGCQWLRLFAPASLETLAAKSVPAEAIRRLLHLPQRGPALPHKRTFHAVARGLQGHAMRITPRPLTIPTLTALFASVVLLNTAGFPFCENPARHPFKTYGGNDFGWPFTYLSTNFTDSQWQQMQRPGGGYAYPARVAIGPTELLSKQDIVTFNGRALTGNVIAWCAILVYGGLVLELCQHQCGRCRPLNRRTLLILLTGVLLIGGLSRSGMFHYWCCRRHYQWWLLGEQVVALAVCSTGVPLAVWYWSRARRHESHESRRTTDAGGDIPCN